VTTIRGESGRTDTQGRVGNNFGSCITNTRMCYETLPTTRAGPCDGAVQIRFKN
jgi:hypothetical protein